jgi:nucleoside-diphosphate-sugar epimerase
MNTEERKGSADKKLGVIVGGSGLIGGYITHYFKVKAKGVELRAPNSKKLSLRNVDDIKGYFAKHRPDFVINCAIAAIDSDAQMAYEVNYMGSVNLARAALALGIPYIHVSSAVTLPAGEDLTEDDHLPFSADMSNYAKSKLMTEMTLKHMHETLGLDYTIIRLAIVYGEHDHKIQGVQRLLFSIVDRAMPFMLTKKGIRHSYSNANKLPYFIDHILKHREEFSGQIYHFVDPEPVELCKLILTLKSYMELNLPKEIYVPFALAKLGSRLMHGVVKVLGRIGIKARVPAELMFLENFYRTQTLSADKLRKSSFVDPAPNDSIFTELPALIEYYLARWEHLNLFSTYSSKDFVCPHNRSEEFLNEPKKLLERTHSEGVHGFDDIC